jgi:predicted nucleotidyltransferase
MGPDRNLVSSAGGKARMRGCDQDGPGPREQAAFAAHEAHRRLLQETLEAAQRHPEVVGPMVMGSVVRGDALPGSDLDLFLLLREGCRRDFRAEVRAGILMGQKFSDVVQARERLANKPMELYSYLDSRILYDPERRLYELSGFAHSRFESYRTPPEETRKQSMR